MYGFERAMREYESRMADPYCDEDYEEEYQSKEDYLETQAEYMMEEMKIRGDEW